MTTEMVETYRARREVNLGWCKRYDGDFIHEYTSDTEIDPRARERLIRMGYIERRTVPQSELDAWREQWEQRNAPVAVEGSETVEGEVSQEETPDTVPDVEEATVIPEVEEETIEDLGPVEEDPTDKKAPAKKVVRTNTRRRRSN